MRVVNLGSLNVDHVYRVEHFLRPGETLNTMDYKCYPGGKGLNQSIAMARAGMRVHHAGKASAQEQMLLEVLAESGVDISLVERTGRVPGHTIIQVNREGENCILLYGGSNREVDEPLVDLILGQLDKNDLLVLQNEISSFHYILREAQRREIMVVLNPSPIDEELLAADLSGVTWIVLNEIEGEALTREVQPESIVRTLLERYPQMRVVLTMGAEGALYQDKEQRIYQPCIPVSARDTTAAGDTFTGYFISGVCARMPLPAVMARAAWAAALAVSREGAASSIPWNEEVIERMERDE